MTVYSGQEVCSMPGDQAIHDAYKIVRNFYNWFNVSPYLPNMLLGSNATNGLPGGGLIYHSPVGTPNDLVITEKYFDQDYWIDELKNDQPLCISNYPGVNPHCYELLGLEAFLDEYIATGLQKYIDAVKGGWEIYNQNFEHIGGTTAIGEGSYYPPKSFYLYPTRAEEGETCGSVFWTNINTRLLHLYPDEEKYAAEIEKSIYNVLWLHRTLMEISEDIIICTAKRKLIHIFMVTAVKHQLKV